MTTGQPHPHRPPGLRYPQITGSAQPNPHGRPRLCRIRLRPPLCPEREDRTAAQRAQSPARRAATDQFANGAPAVSVQEFVCAAPNVAFCARQPIMPAGTPACAADPDRITGRQRKRTRCRRRGHHRYQALPKARTPLIPAGPASAAVATRRVTPQSGRTFSACGPFCPWVVSNSTFWFSSSDL